MKLASVIPGSGKTFCRSGNLVRIKKWTKQRPGGPRRFELTHGRNVSNYELRQKNHETAVFYFDHIPIRSSSSGLLARTGRHIDQYCAATSPDSSATARSSYRVYLDSRLLKAQAML